MSFTSKEKIAEQVLLELNKRNQDSNIKLGEVLVRLSQELGRVIFNRFVATKADEIGEIDGSLYYTFTNGGEGIPVQYDSVMQQYYFVLPCSTTAMLYGMGLKSAAALKSPNKPYRQVQNGFNELFDGLAAQGLEGRIGYYPESDKCIFVNMTAISNPASVVVTMLAPLNGMDEDTQINIPDDIQGEAIDRVIQHFAPMPPKDLVNDRVDAP